MYLIGFLRYITVFLVNLVGLYLFTVRRERCQIKFHICIVISILFQYLIYYFEFTNDADVPGMPISKILTLLMISFLIFGGGLFVYGGWSRIGIYIFGSDLILGIADRLYWAAWEMITHRPVEQAVIYYEGSKVIEWNSFFAVLLNYALLIPLLIGAYKLRNRPLRPAWLVKAVVIIYLILGASPLVARTGMEDAIGATGLITIFVWVDGQKYLVSTCIRFKGLEADAIVLMDLNKNSFFGKKGLEFYVGSSRAKIRLDMICELSSPDYYRVVHELDANAPYKEDPNRMMKILGNTFSAEVIVEE